MIRRARLRRDRSVGRRWSRRRRHRSLPAPLAAFGAVVAVLAVGLLSTAGPASAQGGSSTWSLSGGGGDLLAAVGRSSYDEQDGSPTQTASPDVPGRPALQFSLHGGDTRSEVRPKVAFQSEGDVQYTSYRAHLDPEFPTDVDTWQLVLQWHHSGDSGSPPVAVEVRGDRLVLASEGRDYQDLGPVSGGQSIDLVLRIDFERGGGTVDVWNHGARVLNGYRPPNGTLIDEGNYMKFGLYRDSSISQPGRLWVDDVSVGPSMQSVRPELSEAVAAPADDSTPAPPPARDTAMVWAAGGLLVVVAALVVRFVGSARRRTG